MWVQMRARKRARSVVRRRAAVAPRSGGWMNWRCTRRVTSSRRPRPLCELLSPTTPSSISVSYILLLLLQLLVIIIIIITRLDGKRPDGLALIPWQGGKPLTWDVSVVSTLADSYLHFTSHSASSAAETASVRN